MNILEQYLDGVAVIPLKLVLQITEGNVENEQFYNELAHNLGGAMMLTYMLRDIKDDARQNHLYIPQEILTDSAINVFEPVGAIENKNIGLAREKLAKVVAENYLNAETLLNKLDKRNSISLRYLKNLSQYYFNIMQNRGWDIISPKPTIGYYK